MVTLKSWADPGVIVTQAIAFAEGSPSSTRIAFACAEPQATTVARPAPVALTQLPFVAAVVPPPHPATPTADATVAASAQCQAWPTIMSPQVLIFEGRHRPSSEQATTATSLYRSWPFRPPSRVGARADRRPNR